MSFLNIRENKIRQEAERAYKDLKEEIDKEHQLFGKPDYDEEEQEIAEVLNRYLTTLRIADEGEKTPAMKSFLKQRNKELRDTHSKLKRTTAARRDHPSIHLLANKNLLISSELDFFLQREGHTTSRAAADRRRLLSLLAIIFGKKKIEMTTFENMSIGQINFCPELHEFSTELQVIMKKIQVKSADDNSTSNIMLYKKLVGYFSRVLDHIIRGLRDSAGSYTHFSRVTPRIKTIMAELKEINVENINNFGVIQRLQALYSDIREIEAAVCGLRSPPNLNTEPVGLSQEKSQDIGVYEIGHLIRDLRSIAKHRNLHVYDYLQDIPMKKIVDGLFSARISPYERVYIKYPSRQNAQETVDYRTIQREAEIWSSLEHDRIVPLIGFFWNSDGRSADPSELRQCPAIIHRYFEDNLGAYLSRQPEVSIDSSIGLNILKDVASALSYLHSKNVHYGAVKTNDIFLDKGRAYLCGFGLSKALVGATSINYRSVTPRFRAPELNDHRIPITTSTDMYAFGCLCIQVLVGKAPWSDKDDASIEELWRQQKFYPPPEASKIEDEFLRAFVLRCLSVDKKLRPMASVAEDYLKDCITRLKMDPPLC